MKITKITFYLIDINEQDYPLEDAKYEVEQALEEYGSVTFDEVECVEKTLPGIDFDSFEDSKWNNDAKISDYKNIFGDFKTVI